MADTLSGKKRGNIIKNEGIAYEKKELKWVLSYFRLKREHSEYRKVEKKNRGRWGGTTIVEIKTVIVLRYEVGDTKLMKPE